MLNPPEREKYNLGRVVGNIASKVFKNKSPSSKAVKGEMEKVHGAVNEARLDFKVNEAHNSLDQLTVAKGKVAKEKDVLTLMRYYELVKELKKVNNNIKEKILTNG